MFGIWFDIKLFKIETVQVYELKGRIVGGGDGDKLTYVIKPGYMYANRPMVSLWFGDGVEEFLRSSWTLQILFCYRNHQLTCFLNNLHSSHLGKRNLKMTKQNPLMSFLSRCRKNCLLLCNSTRNYIKCILFNIIYQAGRSGTKSKHIFFNGKILGLDNSHTFVISIYNTKTMNHLTFVKKKKLGDTPKSSTGIWKIRFFKLHSIHL